MTTTASFADSPYYRPLGLKGYSLAPSWSAPYPDSVSEAQARRIERRTKRKRAEARRKAQAKEMGVSLAKAVATVVVSAALGVNVFGYLSDAYGVPEAEGYGGSIVTGTDAVEEIGDVDYVVPTWETGIDGWEVPDIAGDCPVVYQRAEDGSFVNTNGVVLGTDCRFGVDVSEHDGLIDWEAAKEGGVQFAIIRCGYGADNEEWDDIYWDYNVSECERLGIPYGAYLYSYAPDPSYALTEANHVVRLVEGHSVPLGVWYDIEEGAQAESFGYDAELFDELVDGFASVVESQTGIEVGVYTSRSWLDEHMSKVYTDGDVPIWCACWTDGCPADVEYDYWQAGAALIPGFNCQVDFDVILG